MLTSTLPHHLVVIDCETTGLGSNDRGRRRVRG